MFHDADHYSRIVNVQLMDGHGLLDFVLDKMTWTEGDVVMDVGCGSGDSAITVLLPRIPKMKGLIAIDIEQNMIDFAKLNRSHEKIEYHVADVQNWSTLRHWEGTITKIFSVDCFHWVKQQEEAFENVFRLLSSGGEAAFLFNLSASLWECFPTMINNPRWNKYLKDVDQRVPTSHYLKYDEKHYCKLLKAIGFEVLACVKDHRRLNFDDDTQCKMFLKAICPLYSHIPDDESEEFSDDYLETIFARHPRGPGGKPTPPYTSLTVHVKKN